MDAEAAGSVVFSFFTAKEATQFRAVSTHFRAGVADLCTFSVHAAPPTVHARRLAPFRACFPRAAAVNVNAKHMADADAVHLHGVRSVRLECSGNAAVTDEAVRALASAALRHLDVYFAPSITGEAFADLQGLETLVLTAMRSLDTAVCRFPPSLWSLEMMESSAQGNGHLPIAMLNTLTGLQRLQLIEVELEDDPAGPVLDLPHLQILVVMSTDSDCRFAAFDWARFPALLELDLSPAYPYLAPSHSLTRLSAGLRKLTLWTSSAVDDDLPALPALEELFLGDADGITGDCLARFPRLRKLKVRACHSLWKMHFAPGTPLEFIDVDYNIAEEQTLRLSFANTDSVKKLYLEDSLLLTEATLLHFPRLEELFAANCQHFYGPGTALFAKQCTTLKRIDLFWGNNLPAEPCTQDCVDALKGLGFSVDAILEESRTLIHAEWPKETGREQGPA